MKRTRGALTFVFDDGYAEIYDRVLPLLHELGIRAVFAVPVRSDTVATAEHAPVIQLAQWQQACVADGHELAAHGVDHRPLTSLSPEQLARDLTETKQQTGATTLVYPGGAHDARVRRDAAAVYAAARTTRWGMERLPPLDPYALKTYNATRKNFSLWRWNVRLLLACLRNRWCIETFHRVTADPQPFHAVPPDRLARHLRFARRLPIRIVTICDVLHKSSSV